MLAFTLPIVISRSCVRSAAIATLMGSTMLITPVIAAGTGQLAQTSQVSASQTPAAAGATEAKPETVEQRIITLHSALKITAAEEPDWNSVAQAMRDNAVAMQKLVAEKMAQAPQGMTAVDDLNTYAKFSEAHVVGLKNLTSSFEVLYKSMPDDQKKVADQVFESSRHEGSK